MFKVIGRSLLVGAFTLAAGAAWAQDMGAPVGAVKTPEPVTGEQIFNQVCKACHQAEGKGAVGAATVPALAKNPKLADPGYPIGMVTNGRGGMPPLHLSPMQVANVVTYVRTHFGNHYTKPVTEADVKLITGQ